MKSAQKSLPKTRHSAAGKANQERPLSKSAERDRAAFAPATQNLMAEGWMAFLQLFCPCGWVATQNEAGMVYCDNPRCGNRASAFAYAIVLKEIGATDRPGGRQ